LKLPWKNAVLIYRSKLYMAHAVFGAKLSRDTDQRQALLKGLAGALIRSESIETTEAKAKAARDLIEKLITQAKRANLSDIRQIEAVVADKDLVDKLVKDIALRFGKRSGGYLRLVKTGYRVGDNAPMVRMELTAAATDVIKSTAPAKTAALKKAVTKKTAKKTAK